MKLAKFALTCDGEKITSLEQLKEHFNLLDVLEHYKTKTLWRWLRSRGYQNELAGIEAIAATQDTEILKALCGVFGIEADQQMIQEVLEDRKNMEEKEALKAEIKGLKEQIKTLQSPPTTANPCLEERLKIYQNLKDELLKPRGLARGKATLKELLENYADFLEQDKREIADRLYTLGDSTNDEAVALQKVAGWIMGSVLSAVKTGGILENPALAEKSCQALLFYFLAHPIFKADELDQWSHCLPYSLSDMAELLGVRTRTITLDFDTLQAKAHVFGGIVCFENSLWLDGIRFVDKNNQPLKHIGDSLFISDAIKIILNGDLLALSANHRRVLGIRTLDYLELDL
ncbi:hypothetical protein [Helicobacter salomonis]|uniref:hypothetical protein n=1 Tax=Helicobacter salomonis TaxID=56878 RepID=UPI000CF12A03|nr:hypothetical protein [Helicobacter salomonis]